MIRITLVAAFAEAPGDGPTRAVMGWHWYLTGHTSFYANWLPGHEILIAAVFRLLPDPMWGGRLLSLVTGIAAVPLMHRLTRHLYGPRPALIAAAALALSPMHGALSATSLSEAPALLALLAAMLATFRLGQRFDDPLAWATLAGAGAIGASIRFEFWLAMPVLVLHQLWAGRSLRRAALVALALAPFPLLWAAQRIDIGGLTGAYAGAVSGAAIVGASAVDLGRAVLLFTVTLQNLLGLPLLVAATAGLALASRGASTAPGAADRGAHLVLVAGLALFLLKFTADRGAALWPRYLLTEAVLLLPLAGLAVARLTSRPAWHALAVTALLAGAPVAAWSNRGALYLTSAIPDKTLATARWIEARLTQDEAVLMTRAGWQSSYLPALCRMAPERYRIVSDWLSDDELRSFARRRRPRTLISDVRDEDLVRRLTRLTGLTPASPPLARFGSIEIRMLRPDAEPS